MADVERTVAECALAIPGARIDPGAFADYLRSRVAESDAESALAGVHARDLFAAFGCLQGDAACLRWFEKTVLSRVPDFVARVDASASFADEVTQEVRAELLVAGRSRPAGLTGFSGAGELGGFVRVVAVRAALRLANRRKEPQLQMAPSAAGADPELDYLKLRYRSEFERAFRTALAALSTRDRLMLKLHSVDGLSIDKIAAAYQLHRSNAARRLARIRRLLREQTMAELQQRLGASPREVESLLALVRSQMWVSLRGALQQR